MIERDSRDYLTEDTLNVIMKSVEAVSRMGSLTLGRATSDSAKDNHIDHTLKKPTRTFFFFVSNCSTGVYL